MEDRTGPKCEEEEDGGRRPGVVVVVFNRSKALRLKLRHQQLEFYLTWVRTTWSVPVVPPSKRSADVPTLKNVH